MNCIHVSDKTDVFVSRKLHTYIQITDTWIFNYCMTQVIGNRQVIIKCPKVLDPLGQNVQGI